MKHDLYGLKFYYANVLRQPWPAPDLLKPPSARRLADIVTVEQMQRINAATKVLSYRVFFYSLYSLGLRLGDGLRLQVADIDAERNVPTCVIQMQPGSFRAATNSDLTGLTLSLAAHFCMPRQRTTPARQNAKCPQKLPDIRCLTPANRNVAATATLKTAAANQHPPIRRKNAVEFNKIFPYSSGKTRACPTIGFYCGALRDLNLTLFVGPYLGYKLGAYA